MRSREHKIIPARISSRRSELGLRAVDMVEKMNCYIQNHPEVYLQQKLVDKTQISHWECGYRSVPDKYAEAIMYALSCSRDYLYGKDLEGAGEQSKRGDAIPYNRIYLYDRQPVFVIFRNTLHVEQWGLVDYTNDKIKLMSGEIKLSATNRSDYNSIIKELRPLAPYDLSISGNNREQQINLKQAMLEDRVVIKMRSTDPYVAGAYNGIYRHNETKTAFINAVGHVMPYEGINISYNVYTTGYINMTERLLFNQKNKKKSVSGR